MRDKKIDAFNKRLEESNRVFSFISSPSTVVLTEYCMRIVKLAITSLTTDVVELYNVL